MHLEMDGGTIRIGRYAPGNAMATHAHDRLSLCLVAGGRYEESIRGRVGDHAAGSALVCPPGEAHAQRISSDGALKVILRPRGALLDLLADTADLREAPTACHSDFARTALGIASELRRPDGDSRLICESLAAEAWARFDRAWRTDVAATPSPWLVEARAFAVAQLEATPSLDAIGRQVDRHPVHLARAFRRAFGISIGDHVRQARVKMAASLLAAGVRPLREIALDCGFSDQAHMTRAFRTAFGVTPAAYRRVLQ